MTYKEFKEMIEKTGEYQVSDIPVTGKIVYRDSNIMCYISDVRRYKIDIVNSENGRFLDEYGDVVFELASTPIEDRYPVKKYYVKPDLPEFIYKQSLYLNKIICDEYINYTLNNRFQVGNHQTQFTMEEIKEIIPKEDMDKFKLVPVEEEK